MNLSSSLPTSSSAASSPFASKSPVMPTASEKPDSRMSVEPSSFDAAATSQVRLKDAYLGGLMEGQRRDPSHQEEEDSEDSDNSAAGTFVLQRGTCCPKRKSVGETPCTRSQFIS